MSLTLLVIFLAFLLAYVYSANWAGVDSTYPIGLALCLLVLAAGLEVAGDAGAASTFVSFVYFLLIGGVVLILAEHRRQKAGAFASNDGGQISLPHPGSGKQAPAELW